MSYDHYVRILGEYLLSSCLLLERKAERMKVDGLATLRLFEQYLLTELRAYQLGRFEYEVMEIGVDLNFYRSKLSKAFREMQSVFEHARQTIVDARPEEAGVAAEVHLLDARKNMKTSFKSFEGECFGIMGGYSALEIRYFGVLNLSGLQNTLFGSHFVRLSRHFMEDELTRFHFQRALHHFNKNEKGAKSEVWKLLCRIDRAFLEMKRRKALEEFYREEIPPFLISTRAHIEQLDIILDSPSLLCECGSFDQSLFSLLEAVRRSECTLECKKEGSVSFSIVFKELLRTTECLIRGYEFLLQEMNH